MLQRRPMSQLYIRQALRYAVGVPHGVYPVPQLSAVDITLYGTSSVQQCDDLWLHGATVVHGCCVLPMVAAVLRSTVIGAVHAWSHCIGTIH